MSFQLPIPVPSQQARSIPLDETLCNELTGSYPTQKDWEGGTKNIEDVSGKAVSSEDEFPDGGLRAWAVVLGVR
jgi:hypothetical protein